MLGLAVIGGLFMISFYIVLTGIGVCACMVGLMEAGRRIGVWRNAKHSEDTAKPFVALEGSVFGLMGLLLAFTFSSAASRFETRRHLAVEEANAIGTAWLRLDLLPAPRQTGLRENFRAYMDSRMAFYRDITDSQAVRRALFEATALQQQIWSQALTACSEAPAVSTPSLVLGSLNAMFDVRTTRTVAANTHLSSEIAILLILCPLLCSFLAGISFAARARRSWTHMLAFAAILSFTVFVIFDLEYPRVGMIRLDEFDKVLIDLRIEMQASK